VGYVGGTALDNRRFVEAVVFRYRAGIPWRDLPERFGKGSRSTSTARGAQKWGAGDEALGRGRGGLRTKTHAAVAARGNPVACHLTGGQASALAGADAPPPGIAAPTPIADRGYDAEARVLAPLRDAGKTARIPPRRNRKDQRGYDRALYAARHLIEHFFCKRKQFRASATRCDKTKRNFRANVHLAATVIILN